MSSQKKVLGAIAIGATLIGSVARVAWRAAETAPTSPTTACLAGPSSSHRVPTRNSFSIIGM